MEVLRIRARENGRYIEIQILSQDNELAWNVRNFKRAYCIGGVGIEFASSAYPDAVETAGWGTTPQLRVYLRGDDFSSNLKWSSMRKDLYFDAFLVATRKLCNDVYTSNNMDIVVEDDIYIFKE